MDELGQKARLELEFILKGINESLSGLQKFSDQSDEASRATERYRKASRSLNSELGKVAREQSEAAKGISAQRTGVESTAKATSALTAATKLNTDSIIAQRYALYDVASTYAIVGAAMLATSGYAVKVGADFESAFTNVERTSEGSVAQLESLRDALIAMSTEIPLSFQELSKIAALGNQLGIDASQVESFTQTVARFSAVSGLSAEATAQAFGRIGNILGVLPPDFEALGSAIAYAARTGAATETQIVSLTERLGATATRAGFTAAEVVGLSEALASLGVAPERAQGVFESYFNAISSAINEGGPKLQAFTRLTGLSADSLQELVNNGGGVEILGRVLKTLESGNITEVDKALSEVGLTGLRVNEVIPRLSDNFDKFENSLAGSSKAFSEAQELTRQYALVVDDLNSQWVLLVNAVNGLIEAFSGGLVPGIAGAIGVLKDFIVTLTSLADNPWISAIGRGLIVLVGVTGAIFALRAAYTLAGASALAFKFAQESVAKGGLFQAIGAMIGGLLGYTTVAEGASVATYRLRDAMIALGRATLIIGAIQIGAEFLFNFNGAASTTLDILANIVPPFIIFQSLFVPLLGLLRDGARGMADLQQGTSDLFDQFGLGAPAQFFADGLNNVANVINNLRNGLAFASNDIAGFQSLIRGFAPQTEGSKASDGGYANARAQLAADQATAANSRYADSLADVGKSAGGAAKKVRTLVDYASDLSTVFSRSFDIRFGSQLAIDGVTSSWQALNEEIAEYRQRVLELTADKAVKEYFLSVANAYGDTLRAGVLTAEIAGINDDLADAQAGASSELKGNSKAAIENRKRLTGLIGGYQKYIESLASSGVSQEELSAAVARSKTEFIAQATALGYSNSQLQPYIASFNDMAIAVARVPRNITVTANTNPALQALNEFVAKARSSGASAGSAYGSSFASASLAAQNKGHNDVIRAQIAAIERYRPFTQLEAGRVAALKKTLIPGYSGGGYTGDGGKYEPKGIVHGGEFVFSKQATRTIGVQNLARQHSAAKRGYAGGAPVGGVARAGDGIVELGPRTLRVMREEIGNTILNLGDIQIAQSANRGNRALAGQGVG